MPFTPAEKRWDRFLASHGDEYRRLPKQDQREIRELVERNDSRDARTITRERDEQRRATERVRSKLRRVMAKPASQRKGTNPFAGADANEIAILRRLYEGKAV
jgi:hypothetical protein